MIFKGLIKSFPAKISFISKSFILLVYRTHDIFKNRKKSKFETVFIKFLKLIKSVFFWGAWGY